MDVSRISQATETMEEAVDLYNSAVANEVTMLRRGFSTLVNTINVEDKRNSAQEDLIAQQSALAKAIVRLRNETGSLLRLEDGDGVLERENLVTIPQPEFRGEAPEKTESGS